MLVALAGACDGTKAALNDGGHADGAAADAARFACGNTFCDATQICLYPAYGCISIGPSDGGVCPSNFHLSDAGTDCLQNPPTPSCVTPAAGSGSYDCSQGAGGPCIDVNAPVPTSCGRICREICI